MNAARILRSGASTGGSGTTKRVFDYVVVGAGSAGCVLANRLSRNPQNKVAIIEAGGNDHYPWIHIPVVRSIVSLPR